jgi:DNA polymerase V
MSRLRFFRGLVCRSNVLPEPHWSGCRPWLEAAVPKDSAYFGRRLGKEFQQKSGWSTARLAAWGHRLAAPTVRFDLLLDCARLGVWRPGVPVTRLHVVATNLRRLGAVQLGMFEPPAVRAEAVAKTKREVNAGIGRFAVRSGATLYRDDLYRDEASGYGICDVRGKMCF